MMTRPLFRNTFFKLYSIIIPPFLEQQVNYSIFFLNCQMKEGIITTNYNLFNNSFIFSTSLTGFPE